MDNLRLLTRYLNMPEKKEQRTFATMCSDSPLVGKSLTTDQQNLIFGNPSGTIGKGSFGTIYKRGDKYIEKDQLKDEHIILEIAIMHYLDHPNIMCISGVTNLVFSQQIYMHFSPEGTLFDHHLLFKDPIKRTKLFYEILCGIAYMHSVFIIHCDLKHANILLFKDAKGDFIAKITDFGLSKPAVYTELYRNTVGSVVFSSPQLLKARITGKLLVYDYSIDIWALGIMMYDLIRQDTTDISAFVNMRVHSTIFDIYMNIRDGTCYQSDKFTAFQPYEKGLLGACLNYVPHFRPTALQCLKSKYFKSIRKKKDLDLITRHNKNIPINIKPFIGREDLLKELHSKIVGDKKSVDIKFIIATSIVDSNRDRNLLKYVKEIADIAAIIIDEHPKYDKNKMFKFLEEIDYNILNSNILQYNKSIERGI